MLGIVWPGQERQQPSSYICAVCFVISFVELFSNAVRTSLLCLRNASKDRDRHLRRSPSKESREARTGACNTQEEACCVADNEGAVTRLLRR